MRTLVVAVLVAACTLAWAADEVVVPPITRATLDNGLRVVVVEYHELPLLEFTLIVGAGAAQDPAGKEGTAALVAGTLTKGAGKLGADELARAIESLGGRIGASPGTDGTIVSAEFLAKDFAAGLDLLRQVLLDPTFAKDEIRRARDEQEASIVAALEDTSAVAEKCYAGLLYGAHPYGRPVDGRSTTVAKLGRGDVRDFYERWYRPNNTVLVLVGDVNAADAVRRLREAFGAWRGRPDAVPPRIAPPERITARRVLLVDKPDATQTQIRFGNIAIARNDPRFIPATVGNTILGGGFTSQLIEELRIKRSLTYAAWSQFAARLTGGDFRIGTFTKTPTTTETLQLALQVEGTFRTHPPAPAALEKAKTYLRGQFPLRIESPDALAGRLAEIEFHGLPEDELRTYRARVAAVSGDEVASVAETLMPSPDVVAIVVVGKAAEIRAPLEAAFGPVETMAAAECENLSTRKR
ncbi:MAG TPA: pitrilysin family protein [Candidatus Binatia bacterium]|nr:pitrilysin family protein [Candidatus Binatia bacterium]